MLDTIKKDAQTRMQKSVDSLRHELTRLRTGRASTALIEPLRVSYYGSDTPVSQVATVAIADARSIVITPYEKSMVAAVEKEGAGYDLGHYRDAPPGLRIWCGATVETADVAALTGWLDWAFAEAKASLAKAA